MGRERRRRNRRATGQAAGAVPSGTAVPTLSHGGGAASTAARPVQVRSDRVIERESTAMVREMKRVGVVSAVCFGMLAVLVVVDRLQ